MYKLRYSSLCYWFFVLVIVSGIIQPIVNQSVKEVVSYACHGVVCEQSRLYRNDKIDLVNKINDFRNRVAGGAYKSYPYCVANVNKLDFHVPYFSWIHGLYISLAHVAFVQASKKAALQILDHCHKTCLRNVLKTKWNQSLAIEAQRQVAQCPVKLWYNSNRLLSNMPTASRRRPPPFTRTAEYDHTFDVFGRKCDKTTVILYGNVSEDEQASYKQIRDRTFNLATNGQLDDFWNVDKSGLYDIKFRRSESSEVGCGYMLRNIEGTFQEHQLLSTIVCIYCDFDMEEPMLRKYPCRGCQMRSKRTMKTNRNFLCGKNVNPHRDIPKDIEGLRMECVTMPPAYESQYFYTEIGGTNTDKTDAPGQNVDDDDYRNCTVPDCSILNCTANFVTEKKNEHRSKRLLKSVTRTTRIIV